jgi:hypothetical protein
MTTAWKLTASVLAAVTVLAASVGIADATATTIRQDSVMGEPYSGPTRASLAPGTALEANGTGPTGAVRISCDEVTLDGTTNSDGTRAALTGASLADSSIPDGACPDNTGGKVRIGLYDAPYPGAIIYAPVPDGRDAVSTAPGVRIQAVVTDASGATKTCYYGGSGERGRVALDLYNRDNPNRPVPSLDELQGRPAAARLNLDPDRTSDPSCLPTAAVTAVFVVRGQAPDSPREFDQKLYITS